MLCEKCQRRNAEIQVFMLQGETLVDAYLCRACAGLWGVEALECPECSLTVEELCREERTGCPTCLATFAPFFASSLERVGEACQAAGAAKLPLPEDAPILRLLELKAALRKAIAEEVYEDAARLRDEIRKLQANLPSRGNPRDQKLENPYGGRSR